MLLAGSIFTLPNIGYAQEGFENQIPEELQGPPIIGGSEPLGLTQNAWNKPLRERGESKSRPGYVRYVYNSQQAFPIRTREGMVTTIKLPEGESIVQAFAGDEAGFQVGIPTPQTVVIKAIYPGVDTNLIAYAESGNIYTFYMRSYGVDAREISDFLVDVVAPGTKASFTGSQMDKFGGPLNPEKQSEYDLDNPASAARRIRDPYATLSSLVGTKFEEYAEWTDFNPTTIKEDLGVYVPLKDAGGIIPYRVFRDDRFTYIDYGPNASQINEWPTPLIVIQGVEGPVGNRTAGPGGRMIVLEALGEFILRNGQRTIIVKPKSTFTAENLVEYPTYDQNPLRNPVDLPPGRPSVLLSDPKTVVPVETNERTPSNERPSEIIAIPDVRTSGLTLPKPEKIGKRKNAIVQEIPVAKGSGSPIRNAVGKTELEATGNALTGQDEIQVIQPGIITPVTGGYTIVLGKGELSDLEDRWKSIKVQYYELLIGKSPEYRVTSSGQNELRINAFSTPNEAIALCEKMTEQRTCEVELIR